LVRIAWGYGQLHAVMDAVTISVLFRAAGLYGGGVSTLVWLVAGYNVLTFGSQLGLGWLQDRYTTPSVGVFAGMTLSRTGVAGYRLLPVAAIVLVGLGSAAFHVGAGATVLGLGLDRSARAGFFAAPGALGSGFGLWFGLHPGSGPLWPLALLLVLALGGAVVLAGTATDGVEPAQVQGAAGPIGGSVSAVLPSVVKAAIGLLVLSIAIRSLIGLSAAPGHPTGALLLIGLPVTMFLGHALGGPLADRVGWTRTTVVALVAAAGFLAMPGPSPALLLVGLLFLHATMPVTLVALGRLLPTRLGLAFGWDHFALAVGAVPTVFGWGAGLTVTPMPTAWVLLAAVAVPVALRVSGAAGRDRRPGTGPARPVSSRVAAMAER
jgi:FSR family fosmidomycin resistance protein-like MFS transporter